MSQTKTCPKPGKFGSIEGALEWGAGGSVGARRFICLRAGRQGLRAAVPAHSTELPELPAGAAASAAGQGTGTGAAEELHPLLAAL